MSTAPARPGALALVALVSAACAAHAADGERGLIRGEILRAHNRPLVGALAVAVREEPSPLVAITTTDEAGFFRLKGLPEGTYWTAVLRRGFEPFVSREVPVRGPFPAVLDHVGRPTEGAWAASVVLAGDARGGDATLGLRVIDDRGGPVPDARVRLTRLDALADPVSVKTGPDGRVTIETPAGEFRLGVFSVGKLPLDVPVLALRGGGPVAVEARLLDQPVNYVPDPGEVLPEEWPLAPPGAVASTTIEEVTEADLVAAGEAASEAFVTSDPATAPDPGETPPADPEDRDAPPPSPPPPDDSPDGTGDGA